MYAKSAWGSGSAKTKPFAVPAASVAGLVSTTVSIKPAGRPHDRHCAVGQAVKLVQAARLEQAGHEEDIGAGLDLVGQLVGKAEVGPALPGKPPRQFFEQGVILASRRRPERRAERRASRRLSATAASRSQPFCGSSRPICAKSGTSGRSASPALRWSQALQAALPDVDRGRVIVARDHRLLQPGSRSPGRFH